MIYQNTDLDSKFKNPIWQQTLASINMVIDLMNSMMKKHSKYVSGIRKMTKKFNEFFKLSIFFKDFL